MTEKTPRDLWLIDLGTIDYGEALALQRAIVAAKKAGEFEPDLLLLLEHPAVITLGRRGDERNVVASPETLAARDIRVHRIERGGDVTDHGPGQLVGYPIVALRHLPKRQDVGNFVWNMQEAIIRTLADYDLPSERIDKVIGVWRRSEPPPLDRLGWSADRQRAVARQTAYEARKIAAIGARIEGWISFHGFALNVNSDLDDFNLIVPCGLQDRGVTSMEVELGHPVPLDEVKARVAAQLAALWGFRAVQRSVADLAPLFGAWATRP